MNKFLLTGFITFKDDKTNTQHKVLVNTAYNNVTENMRKEIKEHIAKLSSERPFNMQRTFLRVSKHDKLTEYKKEKNGMVSYSQKGGFGVIKDIIELTI